jgi:hypothetical protein
VARIGVFPGSFNPPTVAHLAMARTAVERLGLDRLDLTVSRAALGKEHIDHPRFDHRIAVLRESVIGEDGLAVAVSDKRLVAEIADGYDALVVGADKWHQILEPEWYEGGVTGRDTALVSLPPVAVFHRSGEPDPNEERPVGVDVDLILIEHDDVAHHEVSSTRARDGDLHLMTEAARRFAHRTGAWIDVEAYDRWASGPGRSGTL